MSRQALIASEMGLRVASLPVDVMAWHAAADANADLTGIHSSQIYALRQMMDVLQERQAKALERLTVDLPPADFARAYVDVLREVVGAQDLWRVFRTMFTQRLDARLRPALDAADLVAASCYATCMDRVRAWNALDAAKFREPPLVSLEASPSPATVSRGGSVDALKMSVTLHRSQRLPIPIVLFPADHLRCAWLWCTIHHEVGHNVDQDLGLSLELAPVVETALAAAGVPFDRSRRWGLWGAEVVADTVGTLLGGGGFASSLAGILSVLGAYDPKDDSNAVHPHGAVRTRLAVALLDALGVHAWKEVSDDIRAAAPPLPPWADSYAADCDVIAKTYLTAPLTALGGRALRELVTDLPDDAARAQGLARYLKSGFQAPASGTAAAPFPWRLVPVAAQLAVVHVAAAGNASGTAVADGMRAIHERTMTFLASIPRPNKLAGEDRRAAIRAQAAAIDFGA